MALAYELFTGAGTAASAGLLIPVANLPGLAANELDDANAERKVALAIANLMFSGIAAATTPLGLAATKGTPAGVSADTINQPFTYTVQYYVNHASGTASVLPLPAGNVGLVDLEDIFGSGISFVSASGATVAGVLIPNSVITAAGGSVPANTNAADARDYLQAVIWDLVVNLATSTAVPVKSRSTAAGVAIPTNLTTLTNLTNSDFLSFFSHTFSLTFQLQLNQLTQSFDLAA